MNRPRLVSIACLALLAAPWTARAEPSTAHAGHAHDSAPAPASPAPDAKTHGPSHGHAHGDAAALVQRLELDQGRRWPTDAPLRAGMASIRADFDAAHPAIHAGEQSDEQYAALAARIEQAVNGIVAQCKLAPAADAQLHYVVGDMLQGAGWMRGDDPARSRHDGASRVHGALRAYAKFFDDPTWVAESGPHHCEHH